LAGDTLTGHSSSATCVVDAIVLNSGTWGAGTADGYFIVSSVSGTFLTAETLDEGVNLNVANVQGGPEISASVSLSTSTIYEGTGSVQVTVAPLKTLSLIWTGGAVDISGVGYKYLKGYLKGSVGVSFQTNLLMGETNFYEQASLPITVSGASWKECSFDISGIADASRNGITKVAVLIYNNLAGPSVTYNFDYVYAAPGPSQIKGFDGDRIISLYPKFYVGTYTGNGTSKTITLPRKGTPSAILVLRGAGTTNAGIIWTSTMTAGDSQQIEGGAILTTAITSVGDCSFAVGAHARVNTSGDPHHYIIMWAD
jgi:hypothetical protein